MLLIIPQEIPSLPLPSLRPQWKRQRKPRSEETVRNSIDLCRLIGSSDEGYGRDPAEWNNDAGV